MSKSFAKDVDIAAVFIWNMERGEYNEVLSALTSTIAAHGSVVIGLHDEVYISDPWGVAVRPHAEQYFGSVKTYAFPGFWNKQLLICKEPRAVQHGPSSGILCHLKD